MNFFKLYIGDYQRDTGSLSLAEHGAYLLMLQHYYATERPLPTGRDLFRLLRASNKAEKDAILKISSMFWTETHEGLVNERAWSEIEKGIHQRLVNQRVGVMGGRRRRTESVTESVTESEPNGNPNQTPDTIELSNDSSPPVVPQADQPASMAPRNQDDGFDQAWREYPKRCGSNPRQPALMAWRARVRAGVSPEELLAGVRRYAVWCELSGKLGSESVMQAKRFFGTGEEYLNDWTLPTVTVRRSHEKNQPTDNSAIGKYQRAIAERDARLGARLSPDDYIELGPAEYHAIPY